MPRKPDDEPLADAELLFRDEVPLRGPAPLPSTPPGQLDEIEGYELAGEDPEEVEPVPPVPISVAPPPQPPAKPKPPRTTTARGMTSLEPAPESRPKSSRPASDKAGAETESAEVKAEPAGPPARVERVWSRWREWGSTLRTLFLVTTLWVGTIYVAIRYEWGVDATFAVLVVGGIVLIILSYPIIITLERPLRMTPEQAVRDYFNALSHLRPHYKRMWLLLSTAGQECKEFNSLGGFQEYWKRKLTDFRAARKIGNLTPIAFKVQDFRAEKSAGKSALNAKFVVRVFAERRTGGGSAGEASVLTTRDQLAAQARGGPQDEELGSFPMAISLIRGPDNMWYLNHGALPVRS